DRDESVCVALSSDRRPMEVRVAVGPAPEDVPLRPVAVFQLRPHLDLNPRSRWSLRVPRRHELVEREGETRDYGCPRAVVVGTGTVGAVAVVVRERIDVVERPA